MTSRSFFPMVRREGATLVFLIAFAGFAFVPAWRTIEIGGMAVFGWLVAALMLISPAITLVVFKRRSRGGSAPNEARADDSDAGAERDGGSP